ncbi:hypothetical protein B0H17DRAFT_1146826 [Mycena rosella]|uniref:Uncharacterized protein n=1 Tax=Mycena rosella TaxID=1033263 RepID=A0AAD7CN38_MYCRO|nr:hypothetical protein B0H17DRAFT_1146826 [Mycena rosella]
MSNAEISTSLGRVFPGFIRPKREAKAHYAGPESNGSTLGISANQYSACGWVRSWINEESRGRAREPGAQDGAERRSRENEQATSPGFDLLRANSGETSALDTKFEVWLSGGPLDSRLALKRGDTKKSVERSAPNLLGNPCNRENRGTTSAKLGTDVEEWDSGGSCRLMALIVTITVDSRGPGCRKDGCIIPEMIRIARRDLVLGREPSMMLAWLTSGSLVRFFLGSSISGSMGKVEDSMEGSVEAGIGSGGKLSIRSIPAGLK